MIKYHKDEKVKVSMIRYPADIREYMALQKVKDLAKNIEDVGLIHKIVLRYGTREIIAGRHRAAAYLVLNAKHGSGLTNRWDRIPCRIVECTDKEAQLISLAENAYRNHNPAERDAVMEEMVKVYLECMKEDAEQNPLDENGKKKKVTKKRAFEGLAPVLGIKAKSIERNWYKNKKKKRKSPRKLEPGVNPMGMEVTRPFQVSATAIQKLIDDIGYHIRHCVTLLGRLDKTKLGFPEKISEKTRQDLRDSMQFLKSFRPSHLCPYCKGLLPYQDNCRKCFGFGWVGSYVIDQTLPELMDTKQPCILIDDRLVSLHDLLEEPQPQQEAIIEEQEEW